MNNPHRFKDASGVWYEFNMVLVPCNFVSQMGVYMFARQVSREHYEVLYIGRASNLATRPTPTHEQYQPALKLGMTHIGATACNSESECKRVEQLLIEAFNPPLNTQHRTNALAGIGANSW